MKEVRGNIWDYHKRGHWIVITTNGTVKSGEEAVMGRGIALEAKERFPSLPYELGYLIGKEGNHCMMSSDIRLVTFPVKTNWWEKADLTLIERSTEELVKLWSGIKGKELVYMVRPGCGYGGLDWGDVKPILEKHLDDRFVVVDLTGLNK